MKSLIEGLYEDLAPLKFTDSRVRVQQTSKHPFNCIGLVIVINDHGETLYATGFLISSNIVLTAAHNIILFKSLTFYGDIFFYPAINGASKQVRQFRVSNWRVPEQYFKSETTKQRIFYDYAVLFLDKEVKLQKYLSLQSDWNNFPSKLLISGYPESKLILESAQNIAAFQYQDIGQLKYIQNKIIHYLISTSEGQDGSPILFKKAGQYFVIGIHQGYNFKKRLNTGVLLTQKIIKQLLIWESQFSPKSNIVSSHAQKIISKNNSDKHIESKGQKQHIQGQMSSIKQELNTLYLSQNQMDFTPIPDKIDNQLKLQAPKTHIPSYIFEEPQQIPEGVKIDELDEKKMNFQSSILEDLERVQSMPFCHIGHLYSIFFNEGKKAHCAHGTAFLIAPEIALTVAHNVFSSTMSDPIANTDYSKFYLAKKAGSSKRIYQIAKIFIPDDYKMCWKLENPIEKRQMESKNDYCLLLLKPFLAEEQNIEQQRYMRITPLNKQPAEDYTLSIFGYPLSKNESKNNKNRSVYHKLRPQQSQIITDPFGENHKIVDLTDSFIYYPHATEVGFSGAPLILETHNIKGQIEYSVVGIHKARDLIRNLPFGVNASLFIDQVTKWMDSK